MLLITYCALILTFYYSQISPFLYQQVAPFNTYYPQLGEHLAKVGVDPAINKWDQPFVLGVVDPHDSLSHPAGVSDVQAESAARLDPDLFTNFMIPSWFGTEVQEPTKCCPFPLPEIYCASQSKKVWCIVKFIKAWSSGALALT